jgi:hypothetical protein
MLKTPQDGGPIQDGFLLNPAWTPNPYDAQVLALGQLDTVRRANLYQSKWLVLPEQGAAIDAYDTYEFDAAVVPGSILWGWQLSQIDASGTVLSSTDALLRLTDACTGYRLLDDFVSCGALSAYYSTATQSERGRIVPWLLADPYMFVSPGRLFVEVSNMSAAAINARLILFFAEPCDMSNVSVVTR